MKKSITKLLALILALVMVCSMSACSTTTSDVDEEPKTTETTDTNAGNTEANAESVTPEKLYYNETGYPICDEPITIKVGGSVGSTLDWQNTYLVKYVEENLGIKMICEPTAADAIQNQYALWLADPASMPDLVINTAFDRSQVDADGANGFWLDMTEYADLMPNLYAFWEEYPQLGEIVKASDGSIYSLTRITTPTSSKINDQIYYRTETLEAAGVDPKAIKTTEDFYQALKKIKETYPDMIPYIVTPDAEPAYRNELNLRTAFGVYSNDNSYMVCTDDNGEVFLADISDNEREYLKYMNKLASEGLIDINDFGKSAEELREDMKSGKYAFWTGWFDPMTEDEQALNDNGDFSWRQNYGFLWGFTTEGLTDKLVYIANNGVLNQAKIMINAETEYPEAIIRLLDFFATPEGQVLALTGKEGETYDLVVDEVTGIPNYVLDNYWDKDNYESAGAWKAQYVTIVQGFAYNWGFTGAVDTAENLAAIPVENTNWWNAQRLLAIDDIDDFRYADLPVLYTAEQKNVMATVKTDLTNFLKTAKAEFIAGVRDPYDDAQWNAFVEQVNSMGWESTLKPIEQEARG